MTVTFSVKGWPSGRPETTVKRCWVRCVCTAPWTACDAAARYGSLSVRAGVAAGPSAEPVTAIALEPIATGLKRPVAAARVGGDRFSLPKDGLVRIVAAGAVLPEPLLDLRDRIATDGSERGLLGLAVHPRFCVQWSVLCRLYQSGRRYGDCEICGFGQNPDYADPDSAQ